MFNITKNAIFAVTLIMAFAVFVPAALGAEGDSLNNGLQDDFLQLQKMFESFGTDYDYSPQGGNDLGTNPPQDESREKELTVTPVRETPVKEEPQKVTTVREVSNNSPSEPQKKNDVAKPEPAKQTVSNDSNLTPSQPTAEERKMADMINKERAANGLAPLKLNNNLVTSARMKSQDMINNDYFGHYGGAYDSPYTLIRKAEPNYKAAGENLAGNRSVEGAHEALMNSSSHRANILNENYTDVGIGVVDGGPYGKMITQHFVGK